MASDPLPQCRECHRERGFFGPCATCGCDYDPKRDNLEKEGSQMSDDDIVDTVTPIFTEEEVYMIGGFLAGWYGVEDDVKATEEAISAVLGDRHAAA